MNSTSQNALCDHRHRSCLARSEVFSGLPGYSAAKSHYRDYCEEPEMVTVTQRPTAELQKKTNQRPPNVKVGHSGFKPSTQETEVGNPGVPGQSSDVIRSLVYVRP